MEFLNVEMINKILVVLLHVCMIGNMTYRTLRFIRQANIIVCLQHDALPGKWVTF